MSLLVALPERIDIERIVNVYSPSLEEDYIKYLVTDILKKQSFYNSKKRYSENYVRFSSKEAFTTYKKHKTHMDFLCNDFFDIVKRRSRTKYVDEKISILYRKPYEVGKNSYLYKLGSVFKYNDLKITQIDDYRLVKKIIEKESKLPYIFKSGKYKFFNKFLNNKLLKIDLEKALFLCKSRYLEHKDYFKYVKEFYQILDIHNGIYKVYFNCDSDSRLYTNITFLPSVYRKYLTYNNKQLIEIDISNSVIYFLSMILYNYINNIILINNYPLLLMFLKSLEGVDVKEVELFKDLAVKGEFYELFIKDFEKEFTFYEFKYFYSLDYNDEYKGTFIQKRKVVKKILLAMLFAKEKQYVKVQNIFKKYFPTLLVSFNLFKKNYGYKEMSHLLLYFESHFVLDVVARKFNKENYRKAPIFSLHDCLITTFDYEKVLEGVMSSILEEKLSYAPKLK